MTVVEFQKIKLIIWDLDDTLWKGTLSDEDSLQVNEAFVSLLHASLDRGIVHSICSKNDYEAAKAQLLQLGLWDLFVFPSINWDPKGKRIAQIIEDMKLRPANVLFVDDNVQNLQEAQYYCQQLMCCPPEELEQDAPQIFTIEAIDTARPRLLQYRQLEQKHKAQSVFSSNEDFLMTCNIQVQLHKDCLVHIDRIHDLIMRSNQLNYTKFRQSKEELELLLQDEAIDCGYVTVRDSYGDYGIVGFYAIKNAQAIHYLFSCRTLGMLVEQYVYMQLGCPGISIVGEVVTQLNNHDLPAWINHSSGSKAQEKHVLGGNVLFKGPCDISQIFSFIEQTPELHTDFTYTNDAGVSIEGHNHTAQITTALFADAAEKQQLLEEFDWFDPHMLDASVWENNNTVILSMLTDSALGVYRHRKTGAYIALCEGYYDLTDPNNWDGYISGDIFTSNISFTRESLERFAQIYEYVPNTDAEVTMHCMDRIYQALPSQTLLILLLGFENPFQGKAKPSYEGRHLLHRQLNAKLRQWAKDKPNIHLLEIGNYIHSQHDFTDTINHFQKKVYYAMAQDISQLLAQRAEPIKVKSKAYLFRVTLDKKLRTWVKKILKR